MMLAGKRVRLGFCEGQQCAITARHCQCRCHAAAAWYRFQKCRRCCCCLCRRRCRHATVIASATTTAAALPCPAVPCLPPRLPGIVTTHLLLATHKPVDRHTQRLIRRRSNRLRTPQLECLHIHISQPPTPHLSSHSHRYPDHSDTSPRRSAQPG